MQKHKVKDHYYHKAKKENFAARSVYKLQDIHSKYQLLKPGSRVLDLGAAPGSWSEFAAETIGPSGCLVSIDQRPLSDTALARITRSGCEFHFVLRSVLEEGELPFSDYDVLLSDLAPWTGGTKFLDSLRSLSLVERSFELASRILRPGGAFVVKLFQSQESMDLSRQWRSRFQIGKLYKPSATHKDSKEIYFVGTGWRA